MNAAAFLSHHMDNRSANRFFKCFAILTLALGINLALFGLMPFLLTRAPSRPALKPLEMPINIIRMKLKDTAERKKPVKPPPPPKQAPKPIQPKADITKLTLPFQINTKLPQIQTDLALDVEPPNLTDLKDIFNAGDLDSPLTVIMRIPPIYPMYAKIRKIEGWVKVRFIVDENGKVSNVSVVESKPTDVFDDAVLRSVSGWRFKAGTIGGTPVKTRAETVVRFQLD